MHRIRENALFLIDGSYILYRSYYGLRPLYTSNGIPTQATYGFCRTIKKIIDDFDPKKLVIVWDSKGKTFRSEMYEEYKATREAPPSDLFIQKDQIQEFANLIGICQISKKGYEADDLIASLVRKNKAGQTIIVGPDKDLFQLINDKNVMIYDSFRDQLIDEGDFKKKNGFGPEKLRFYHSLLGDASDNIPGVKGIGKKGAKILVNQFDSLKDLYKNIDSVKPEGTKRSLIENKDDAFLSYKLFGLEPCDIQLREKDFYFKKDNWIKAKPIFSRLEFKSLLKSLKDEADDSKVISSISERSPLKKNIGEKQQVIKFGLETKTTNDDWICNIIRSDDSLERLIKKIKKEKEFAFDVETTGLNPLQDGALAISIAFNKNSSYYLPFINQDDGQEKNKMIFVRESAPILNKKKALDLLRPVFKNSRIKKIAHNAKFDILSLIDDGIEVNGLYFDTLIVANLLRKDDWQKINLKFLSSHYLDEKMVTFKDLLGKKYKTFADVPLKDAARYASHDSLQTYKLKFILSSLLDKEPKLKKIYESLELPLMFVLIDMEKTGFKLDVKILKDLSKKVTSKLDRIHGKIIEAIKYKRGSKKLKESFNVNSPKQVEELLFDILNLPVVKKSSKGQRSTDQEVLSQLSKIDPIPGLILTYRELFKLLHTYIDPLQSDLNPKTGRIHTSFSQTMVATGRLSSSRPNLQNIPATPDYGVAIRSAFVAPRGRHLLSADYSQMELRVLAHMSKDNNLIRAFNDNIDIHRQTASQLFDIPIEKVTNGQRQVGKRINFSIIYGLTPYGLAKDLGIKPSEAKEYIEKYFEQYPKVSEWIEKTIKEATETGYVQSWLGRRRYLPGLKERNRVLRESAKRMATNTPIQATSAEIIKLGMISLYNAFEAKKIDAKIILQIHDELIIEYLINEKTKVEKIVRKCLENVVEWEVPLNINMRIGKNWGKITK